MSSVASFEPSPETRVPPLLSALHVCSTNMPNFYARENTQLFAREVAAEGHLLERGLEDVIHGFPGLKRTHTQVRNMRFGARFKNNLLRRPRGLGGPMDESDKGRRDPPHSSDPPSKRSHTHAGTVAIPTFTPRDRAHQHALSGGPYRSLRTNRTARLRQAHTRVLRSLRLPTGGRPTNPLLLPYGHPGRRNMSRRAPRRATRAYGGSATLLGGGVGSFANRRYAAAPHTVEVKYVDNAVATQTTPQLDMDMNHQAAAIDLSFVGQGPGQSERIGNDVHLKQLTISYQPRVGDGAGANNHCHWRCTIFLWRPSQSINVKPTWDDIFTTNRAVKITTDAKGVALDTAFAMFNTGTSSSYKILSDKSGTLTGALATPVLGGSLAPIIKVACPLNVVTKFTSAALDGADGSNKVWMLWSATNHTTAAAPPVMSFVSRVWYTDA